MDMPGANVIVENGLCKLTLTAPCCHLLELIENPFAYICFTWDNIGKHIRNHQPITVAKCIKLNPNFTPLVFCQSMKKTHKSLPSSIFQYYPKDPAEDDMPVTMATIFSFSSASKLDAHLAVGVEERLTTSTSFAEQFYYHALLRGKMRHYSNDHNDCDKLILIRLVPSNQQVVPLQWSYKLQKLLWKRLQLEDAMNWLNTLGGGYSALGDYFKVHAVKAAEISSVQLGVALEMGDTPTVIRCHLYFALSLMQRGYIHSAKYRIRYLYQCALNFIETDRRLVNMCLGLWSRLRYIYRVRRQRRRLQNRRTVSNSMQSENKLK